MKYRTDQNNKNLVILECISVFSLNDRTSNETKRIRYQLEIEEDPPLKRQKLHLEGENPLYNELVFPNNQNTSITTTTCPKNQDALTDIANLKILLDKQTKVFKNSFKYNIDNLNLSDKETLIFLIDRNLQNCIIPPVDLFAYSKLNKIASLKDLSVKRYDKYNSLKINHIQKLSKKYDLDSAEFLKHNTLLPGPISYYLTPLFFDIFSINDLKRLGPKTVKFILHLKKDYTPTNILDAAQLTSNIKQNILWNCIALHKFKLPKTDIVKMGAFNFYLCFIYILTHIEWLIAKNRIVESRIEMEKSKLTDMKTYLPSLFNALIINGHFTHSDFFKFKKFAQKKLRNNEENIETAYYQNSLKYVTSMPVIKSPLTLASLCRITVKDNMKNFNQEKISELQLSKTMQSFLRFEDELNCLFSTVYSKNNEKESSN